MNAELSGGQPLSLCPSSSSSTKSAEPRLLQKKISTPRRKEPQNTSRIARHLPQHRLSRNRTAAARIQPSIRGAVAFLRQGNHVHIHSCPAGRTSPTSNDHHPPSHLRSPSTARCSPRRQAQCRCCQQQLRRLSAPPGWGHAHSPRSSRHDPPPAPRHSPPPHASRRRYYSPTSRDIVQRLLVRCRPSQIQGRHDARAGARCGRRAAGAAAAPRRSGASGAPNAPTTRRAWWRGVTAAVGGLLQQLTLKRESLPFPEQHALGGAPILHHRMCRGGRRGRGSSDSGM